jgi:uncharacterized protein
MKTREEILNILKEHKPDRTKRFGISRLALFGLYARGDYVKGSDVDIMVEMDPAIGLRFVELAEEIEITLGVRTDVVSSRSIKPRYWNVIQKDLIDVR